MTVNAPTPEERAAVFAQAVQSNAGASIIQAIEGKDYEFGLLSPMAIARVMHATSDIEGQLIELRRRIKDVQAIVEYYGDVSPEFSVPTIVRELKAVLK